jgi:hypothetical protein
LRLALLAAAALAAAVSLVLAGAPWAPSAPSVRASQRSVVGRSQAHAARAAAAGPSGASGAARPPRPRPSPPFSVGATTETFVDTSRLVLPPHTSNGQPQPRSLAVSVLYPTAGSSPGELQGAPPLLAAAPFPLVVFAPGYDSTPQPYGPLLDAWVRDGYVVAAITFPVTNPATPGGPDESDIVNQPGDVSFVIGQLLAADGQKGSPLFGLIDPTRIAVAGHSDGADTALETADDTCCRDPRVDAVIVMAGQELDVGTYYPPGSPPLLAAQGTSDGINPPSYTYQLFDAAPQPKYLLSLLGGDHIGPFSDDATFEPVVAAVTSDFLDAYLKGRPGDIAAMQSAAGPPSVATLTG